MTSNGFATSCDRQSRFWIMRQKNLRNFIKEMSEQGAL